MNKKQSSILNLINEVHQSIEKSQQEFRELSLLENPDVNVPSKALAAKAKLNQTEALVFAVLFEKIINQGNVSRSQLIKALKLKFNELEFLHSALNKLRIKMLISINSNPLRQDMQISIPVHVQNNIMENKTLLKSVNKFTQFDFEKLLTKLFERYSMLDESSESFYEEIKYYLKYHNNLPVAKFVNNLKVSIEEKIIVLYGFTTILRGMESFNVGHAADMFIFPSAKALGFKQLIIAGESELIHKNILQSESNEFKMSANVRLTNSVLKEIFGDYKKILPLSFNEDSGVNIIKYDSIQVRELYYNEVDAKQINEIKSILMPDNFDTLKLKLKEQQLVSGISILLHGAPGTGKTETVYQVAHRTQRDIITLDISQMRDKYVGESEKLIRKIFGQYRNLCTQTDENIPVLLLNEADALIARRRNVGTSVDQMNNSIQNILLEELEKFEGIFIATTNLPENFDTAFERRFLFKIKFSFPDIATRFKIIRSQFEILSESEAALLSTEYKLSGAQILNLRRKFTMHNLLHKSQPSIDVILKWCRDEGSSNQARNVIQGFRKNMHAA